MKHFHIQKFRKVLLGLLTALMLCTVAVGALLFGPSASNESPTVGAHAEAYASYADREAVENVDAAHEQDPDNSVVKISVMTQAEPLTVAVYYFDTIDEGWTYLTAQLDGADPNNPIEVQLLKETTAADTLTTTVDTNANLHVVFDLNGNTLKNETKPVFTLNGGDIMLTDTTADQNGAITATANVGVQMERTSTAHFTLAGGKITGCTQGAILAQGTSRVDITGGKITGNEGAVAAVRFATDYVVANMTGGEISKNKNTANNGAGGGVYLDGATTFTMSGGEIYGNETLTTSTQNGGGGVFISTGATFTLQKDAVIGGETADKANKARFGGGIYLYRGTLKLEGGTISHNVATSETISALGGGIYADGGTMTSSKGDGEVVISSNRAECTDAPTVAQGGGIYITNGTAAEHLNGGKIIKNTAYSGGGMFVYSGTVKLYGMTIGGKDGDGNIATAVADATAYNAGGGGIYTVATVEIAEGTLISYNEAENSLGGGVLANYSFTMSGGKIEHNTANRGGGVSVNYPSAGRACYALTMTGGEITHNTAKDSGGGLYSYHGGIYLDGGKITYNVTEGNPAERTSGNGGGICIAEAVDSYAGYYYMDLSSGEISHNSAPNGYGGGVYVFADMNNGSTTNRHAFTVPQNKNKLLISDNTAKAGGGLYANGTVLFQAWTESAAEPGEWVTFQNNKATAGDGGAIYAAGAVTFQSTAPNVDTNRYTVNFDSNTASGNGGAISSSAGFVYVNATVNFMSNRATAGNGGGWNMTQKLTVTGTVRFGAEGKGNTASGNGGGLYSEGPANTGSLDLFLANTIFGGTATFVGNSAGGDGGGVYAGSYVSFAAVSATSTTLQTLTVQKNRAGGDGGGVYVNGSSFYAPNLNEEIDVRENTAGGIGGGIWLGINTCMCVGGHVHVEKNTQESDVASDVYLESRRNIAVADRENADSNFGAIYVGSAGLTGDSRIGIYFVPNATYNPNNIVVKFNAAYNLADLTRLHSNFFADDEETYPCLHPNLTATGVEINTIILSSEHSFYEPVYTWEVTEAKKSATVEVEQTCSLGCGKTYNRPLEDGDYGYPGNGTSDLQAYAATYTTSVEATCEAEGYDEYSAQVKIYDVSEKQEKTVTVTHHVTVPALGHKWTWTEGNHGLECKQCSTLDAADMGEAALIDKTSGGEAITVFDTLEAAWAGAASLMATVEGNVKIFLLKDVMIDSKLELTDAHDYVTLDLNGKTVTGKGGEMFTLGGRAHFVIDDTSISGMGAIESGSLGVQVLNTVGFFTLKRGTIRKMATAVVMTGADSMFTMSGGKITACTDGGVRVDGGTFEMSGGAITKNQITRQNSRLDLRWGDGGGGVRVSNPNTRFNMTGGEISYNSVKWCGGGLELYNLPTVNISGGKISGNTAESYGAGIYVWNGTLNISGEAVIGGEGEGNRIVTPSGSGDLTNAETHGGGIYNSGGTVSISGNVEISHNFAYNGGGIYNLTPLKLTGGKIAENTAYNGGGLFVYSGAVTFEAASSGDLIITKNKAVKAAGANGNGGGIYTRMEVTFANVTIQENTAETSGGGICSETILDVHDGALILGNTAGQDGGGIYCSQTNANYTPRLYGGEIKNNEAGYNVESKGGGLYSNGNMSVYGPTVFEGNKADLGGGIYVNGWLNVSAEYDSKEPFTFKGNTARKEGGGLYTTTALDITSAAHSVAFNFEGNTASSGGGAYIRTTVVFGANSNVTFRGNEVTLSGGGLYAMGNVTFNGANASLTVTGNEAGEDGGGIYAGANLAFVAPTSGTSPVSITGNKAGTVRSGYGGGVRVLGIIQVQNKVNIENNTATCDGKENVQSDLYLSCTGFAGRPTETPNVVIVTERLHNESRIGIYLAANEANGERQDVFAYCKDDSFLGIDTARKVFFSDKIKNGEEGQECLYEDTSLYYYMTRHAYPATPEFAWDADHSSVTATLACPHCKDEAATLTKTGTIEGEEIRVDIKKATCTEDGVDKYTVTLTLGTGIYQKTYTDVAEVITPAAGHQYHFTDHTVKCSVCDYLATDDGMVIAVEFDGEMQVYAALSPEVWNAAMGHPTEKEKPVNIYVLNSFTPTASQLQIPANVFVCLDLNGFEIKGFNAAQDVFRMVGAESEFTLTDTSVGKSDAIVNSNGILLDGTANDCVFIFKGGSVKNGVNGVIVNKGTFRMYDGATICDNSNRGVWVTNVAKSANDAKFIMYGGTISGNQTYGGVNIEYGTFELKGGTISGNHSVQPGGGVWIAYNICIFTMSGGEISGNTADGGQYSWGGGIYCCGTFTMTGGKVTGNTATLGGGIFLRLESGSALAHTNRIEKGEITNNTAYNSGGGLYLTSESGAEEHVMTTTFGGGSEEILIAHNKVVIPAETLGTKATGLGGGGIFADIHRVNILDGTRIEHNESNCVGGGFYSNRANVAMSGGSISHNTADREAGGVYNTGVFEFSGGEISYNTVTEKDNLPLYYGIGGGIVNIGTMTLRKTGEVGEISHNTADRGGALYMNAGVLTVSDGVKITNNTGVYGGGIHIAGGTLNFTRSSSSNPVAEISSNQATGSGGGIYVTRATVNVQLFEGEGAVVLLKDNTARVNGGGIYTEGSMVVNGRIDLTHNRARAGGGLYVTGVLSEAETGKMFFTQNEANLGGGMVVNYASGVTFQGEMTFEENTAHQNGGAILARTAITFGAVIGTATKGTFTFTNNKAETSSEALDPSEYASQGNGGAIYTNANIIFHSAVTFTSNSAANDGGAFYQAGGDIYFTDYSAATFKQNTAEDKGGAIAGDGTGTIQFAGNITLEENEAGGSGGAIYSAGALNFTYNNGAYAQLHRDYNIVNNTAGGSGGGIYSAGVISLYNTKYLTVKGNTAGVNGGGIYSEDATPTLAGNVTIENNVAKGNGGGIYCTGGLTLSAASANFTASGNRAEGKGGGVYVLQVFSVQGTVKVTDNKQGTEDVNTPSNVFTSVTSEVDLPRHYGMIVVSGTLQPSAIYVTFEETEANPDNIFLYGAARYLTSTEMMRGYFKADDSETYNCIYYDPAADKLFAYMSSHVYATKDQGDWSPDYKSVNITIICTHVGCIESHTESAEDISSTGGADCVTEGDRIYTASVTFNGQKFEVSTTVHEYASGHNWVWKAEDRSIYCTNCGHDAARDESYVAYVYMSNDEATGFVDVYATFDLAWGAAQAAERNSSGENYASIVLLADVRLAAVQTLQAGKYVRLDLNGCSITGTAGMAMFNIAGGSFILDDKKGGGKLQVGSYAVQFVASNSHFTLRNGIIGSDAEGAENNFTNAVFMDNAAYSDCSVHIEGGVIQHCTNGYGIRLRGTNVLVELNGGEIRNNNGGVYIIGSGGELKVGNIKIHGNTVTGGTAYGGGIYVNSSTNYSVLLNEGADIYENTATDGGGVYLTGGGLTFTMNGAEIHGNTATRYGGGLCATVSAHVEIADGKIYGNQAQQYGGVFVNANVSFSLLSGIIGGESADEGNKATLGGGGLHVDGAGTLAHISGGKIKYNAVLNQAGATGRGYGNGGGIYSNGATVNISGGEIVYNTAANSGGGIYADSGSLSFTSTSTGFEEPSGELSRNTANAGAVGNKATMGGGGVFAAGNAVVTLQCYNYEFNHNISKAYGGAMFIQSPARLEAKGTCKFTFNYNEAQNGDGGGIYTNSTFSVTDPNVELIFNKNKAQMNGGAISAAYVTMSGGNITVSNNEAVGNGGGIYIYVLLTLTGAAALTVSKNTSKQGAGGGMYVQSLTINSNQTRMTLEENTAGGNGGGLYLFATLSYDPVTIGESVPAERDLRSSLTAKNNTAGDFKGEGGVGGNGGGIYFNLVNTVALDLTVEGNTAKKVADSESGNGGGIYIAGNGSSFVFSGKAQSILDNTAENAGGGIYSGGNNVTLTFSGTKVIISRNKAALDGGGIYSVSRTSVSGGDLQVTSNKAQGDGGGVYSAGTFTAAARLTVTENTAGGNGGGVYCRADFCIQKYVLIESNVNSSDASTANNVFINTTDKAVVRNGIIAVTGALEEGSKIYFYYNMDITNARDGLFVLVDDKVSITRETLRVYFYTDRADFNCIYFDETGVNGTPCGRIKHDHEFVYTGDTENWLWLADDQAKLTMQCKNCDWPFEETQKATVKSQTAASCTESGSITYRVTINVNGKPYTATHTVTVEALGHDWKWKDGVLECDRCHVSAAAFSNVVVLQHEDEWGQLNGEEYRLFTVFASGWQEALKAEGRVRLTLLSHASVKEQLVLDSNAKATCVTLVLNGWTLSNDFNSRDGIFIIRDGKTFTMKDGEARTGGNLQARSYGISVEGGIFNLESGAIVGVAGSTLYGVRVMGEGGMFNMNGGKISGINTSSDSLVSAVIVEDGGVFTMAGGKISGNTSNHSGAGVLVQNEGAHGIGAGKFIMKGGEISGNTAKENGGGVYVSKGATFEIKGGVIEKNTAGGNGGGVYFAATGDFKLEGEPVIKENTHKAEQVKGDVYLGDGIRVVLSAALGEKASLGIYLDIDVANAKSYDKGFAQLEELIGDIETLKARFPSNREEFNCWSIEEGLGHLRQHLYDRSEVDGAPNPAWDWTLGAEGYTGVTATFTCAHCKEKTSPQNAKFEKQTLVEGDCTTDREEQVSASIEFDGKTFTAEPQTFTIAAPGHTWAVRVSPSDPSVAEIYCTVEKCEMHEYGLGGTVRLTAEDCVYDAARHTASIVEALSGAGAIDAIHWTDITYRYSKTNDFSSGVSPDSYLKVGYYQATITVSSDKHGDTAAISVTYHIAERHLLITGGITAATKPYDGNHNATLDVSKVTFDNKVSGDDLGIAYGSATFSDKYVGTHKQVTVTGITLTGSAAENYILDRDVYIFESEADITPLELTITGGITVNNKEYDGNKSIGVNVSGVTFEGLIPEDEAFPPVITGYTVELDGADVGMHTVIVKDFILSGDCAVNYTLTTTEWKISNVEITKKFVDVVWQELTFTYDGTDQSAQVKPYFVSLEGSVPLTPVCSGTFKDYRAEGYVFTVTLPADHEKNYEIRSGAEHTYHIQRRGITLSSAEVTADGREYDGTTTVQNGRVLSQEFMGILEQDTGSVKLAVETYFFVSPAAGVNKQIAISGLSLTGDCAENYELLTEQALCNTSVELKKRTVTVEWHVQDDPNTKADDRVIWENFDGNKVDYVYNGKAPTTELIYYTFQNVIGSEEVLATFAALDTPTADVKNSTNVFRVVLDPNSNYTFATPEDGDFTVTVVVRKVKIRIRDDNGTFGSASMKPLTDCFEYEGDLKLIGTDGLAFNTPAVMAGGYSDVGKYPIIGTFSDGTGNQTVEFVGAWKDANNSTYSGRGYEDTCGVFTIENAVMTAGFRGSSTRIYRASGYDLVVVPKLAGGMTEYTIQYTSVLKDGKPLDGYTAGSSPAHVADVAIYTVIGKITAKNHEDYDFNFIFTITQEGIVVKIKDTAPIFTAEYGTYLRGNDEALSAALKAWLLRTDVIESITGIDEWTASGIAVAIEKLKAADLILNVVDEFGVPVEKLYADQYQLSRNVNFKYYLSIAFAEDENEDNRYITFVSDDADSSAGKVSITQKKLTPELLAENYAAAAREGNLTLPYTGKAYTAEGAEAPFAATFAEGGVIGGDEVTLNAFMRRALKTAPDPAQNGDWSQHYGWPVNAGTYRYMVGDMDGISALSGDHALNYTVDSAYLIVVIAPKALASPLDENNMKSVEYDGTYHRPEIASGEGYIVTTEENPRVSGTYTFSVKLAETNYSVDTVGSNPGEAYAVYNYAWAEELPSNVTISDDDLTLSATFVIEKKIVSPADILWTEDRFVYDGKDHASEIRATLQGVPGDGTFELIVVTTQFMNCKEEGYEFRAELSSDAAVNYILDVGQSYTKTYHMQRATYDMSAVAWSYSSPFNYNNTLYNVYLVGLPAGVIAQFEGAEATDAGTYTAKVKGFIYDETNYEAPKFTMELTWVIRKAAVTMPVVSASLFTYNGKPQSYYIIGEGDEDFYTIAGNTRTDAGSQQVTVTLRDKANYRWAGTEETSEDLVSTFTINRASYALFWAEDTFEYTGSDQSAKVYAWFFDFDGRQHKLTAVLQGADGFINHNNGNAYTFIVDETKLDGNYDFSGKSHEYHIAKKAVQRPAEDGTAFYYTGQPLTYHIAQSELYTVSGNVYTEVGDYAVTVALRDPDNYKWAFGNSDALTYSFSIAPGQNEILDFTISGWTYGEEPAVPSASAKFGVPVFTYCDSPTGAFTSYPPANAGTWYVKATVVGSTQYMQAEKVISFEISKKSVELVWAADEFTYNGRDQSNKVTASLNMVNGNVVSLPATTRGAFLLHNGGAKYVFVADTTGYENYEFLNPTHEYTMKRAPLTVYGVRALAKLYDGGTAATLNDPSMWTVYGLYGTDTVTVTGTGVFDGADVGLHTVVATLTLSGSASDNYVITNSEIELTGVEIGISKDLALEALRRAEQAAKDYASSRDGLTDAQKEELRAEIEHEREVAEKDISDATTSDGILDALDGGRARMDAASKKTFTGSEPTEPEPTGPETDDLAKEKQDAKDKIDDEAQKAKDEVDSDTDLSDEEKDEAKKNIEEEAEKAKDKIDGAKSKNEVEGERDKGIQNIQSAADASLPDFGVPFLLTGIEIILTVVFAAVIFRKRK